MSIQVTIYFLLLIILSAIAFILGQNNWLKNSRNRIGIIILRVLLLMIICGAGWLKYHPEVEYYLIPDGLGLFFDIVWVFPLAIFFISAGSKLMSTRFASKGLVVLSLLVLIVAIDQSSWVMAGPSIKADYFTINKDGVCIQSTGYTCGAASAVTLLNYYGVQTDEPEMARLSHTTRHGIKVTSLARGIKRKVADLGFEVDICRLELAGLKELNQPCIITTQFGFMVDHVVVFLGIDQDGVWIGDPLTGKVKWSKEKFIYKWRGIAIILSSAKESHHQDTKALRNNR